MTLLEEIAEIFRGSFAGVSVGRTRTGTGFCGEILSPLQAFRLIDFRFGLRFSNFGDRWIDCFGWHSKS
jgi:hypothetical protein